MLILNKYGKNRPMTLALANYADNGNLYIGLVTDENGYPEPWSDLTVNTNNLLCKPNCAFIDTNNNGNEIIAWLKANNLGKETGRMAASGWCIYPEFEFDMNEVEKYVYEDNRM